MKVTERLGKRAQYLLVLGVALLACALPAWATPFPPATDLPQHLAQVEQALFRPLEPGAYAAWWAPNNLIYLPLAGLRVLVGPAHLASATVGLLGAFWAGATCWLGARLRRSAGGIALASLLFFNSILHWGMLNFLLGWPVLLAWLAFNAPGAGLRPPSGGLETGAQPTGVSRADLQIWALGACLGWLLLWAHALCFAAACAFACVLAAGKPHGAAQPALRQRLRPLLPLVPTGLYAVWWVITLRGQRAEHGFDVAPHYAVSLLERLDPDYFLPRSVAAGALTWAFFGALVAWILSGALRPGPGRHWERSLLACAGVLAVAYLGLPSKYLNTIEFSSRWLPCLWVLLVLASPGPPAPARAVTLVASGAALLVSASVGWNWKTFARTELAGLPEALAATPLHARLLGLDFLGESALIGGRPFLHLGAYATLLRGASTNFDFSEHGTALIRGAHRSTPWTPGLEWFPERVQPSDLTHFDVVLVGALPEYHEQVIGRLPGLTARTHSGLWRLYASDTAAPAAERADALNPAARTPIAGSAETGESRSP